MCSKNNPVFVLSTGRCGTLALQRLLSRSNQVEAFHRYRGYTSRYRNDMSFVLEQNYAYYHVLRSPDCNLNTKNYVVRNLQRCRKNLIKAVLKEGKKFIELNHEFSSYGPLLMEAFPYAKFMHLVRHPKSVVSSLMRKSDPLRVELPAFMGTRYSLLGQYTLRYRRIRRLSGLGPKVLRDFVESHRFDTHLHPFEKINGEWKENEKMSAFEKTCWYWNEVNRLIVDFFKVLPEERRLRICFEDIFESESDAAKKAFLDFLGISDITVSDMNRFFGVKVNVKEVYNSTFPTPEKWNPNLVEAMKHFCQQTMDEVGCS